MYISIFFHIVLCWGLGENDPTLTKCCACAQEMSTSPRTVPATNMKRQKLAVGSLEQNITKYICFTIESGPCCAGA